MDVISKRLKLQKRHWSQTKAFLKKFPLSIMKKGKNITNSTKNSVQIRTMAKTRTVTKLSPFFLFICKQGQELANRCVPELPRVAPGLPQGCPELPRLKLARVTKTYPNLFQHFGHYRIIQKKWVKNRPTDGTTDGATKRPTDRHTGCI